jgi:3'-phosphoadenosine 5'-phosphosulfate sulfotransferase (PAPS reductase)/FAD synthetase
VDRHRPNKVLGLFSGGHDSLCACHMASTVPPFDGCVHVNTGIGVEATREFVRSTCRQNGWPLLEYHPPVSYEEIVLRWGFPGPAGHTLVYNRLKERCLRQLVRDHKAAPQDCILLVSGVRRQESRWRMGFVQPIQQEGARVWVTPLAD